MAGMRLLEGQTALVTGQLARHRSCHRAEACGRGSGDLAPLPSKRSRRAIVGRENLWTVRLLKADLGAENCERDV